MRKRVRPERCRPRCTLDRSRALPAGTCAGRSCAERVARPDCRRGRPGQDDSGGPDRRRVEGVLRGRPRAPARSRWTARTVAERARRTPASRRRSSTWRRTPARCPAGRPQSVDHVSSRLTSIDYAKGGPRSCRRFCSATGMWSLSTKLTGLRPTATAIELSLRWPRAPPHVMLTATPHNGDRAAFDALCSLGQTSNGDPLLIFRRRRVDVAPGHARRVHRVDVGSSAAERRMYERLEQFSRALELERRADPAARLTLTMLHKRALSSAWSLETSVRRRIAVLDSSADHPFVQLALPLGEAGRSRPAEEPPGWMWPRSRIPRSGLLLASPMPHNRPLRETGARAPHQTARTSPCAKGIGDRFAVSHTLAHVRRMLATPCALIHGGLSLRRTTGGARRFPTGPMHCVLATDAGEGLNLHHALPGCRQSRALNPMRLEQRTGRVDRIGQTRGHAPTDCE